jgi:hypothetical protein
MLYTLEDAIDKVKRFVDGGSCSVSKVTERINDALERLMEMSDWDSLEVMTRINTCKSCFPLPYNVEKLIACDIGGKPAKIFGRHYQFMHSGPGDLDMRCCMIGSEYKDIVDMGSDFPTMFDIPCEYTYSVDSVNTEVSMPDGWSLVAFCNNEADAGKKLNVFGFTANGENIKTGAAEGEELTLEHWTEEGVIGNYSDLYVFPDSAPTSTNLFKDISNVIKDPTEGYVSLYAIDLATNAMSFLAKYHPKQTIPQFRKYRVTNSTYDSTYNSLLALMKMKYVPLSLLTDILPIESLQAVKLMVMAISEENKMNIEGSVLLANQAYGLLVKKDESKTLSDGVPVIVDVDYRMSLAAKINRSIIL